MAVGEQVSVKGGQVVPKGRVNVGGLLTTEILEQAQGVTTYRGHRPEDGSAQVIKTIAAAKLGATARARLDYEVEVLNQEVAAAVHLGTDGPLVFVARPFLSGVTLENRLTRGSLPAADVVSLAITIIGALTHIHPRGVLHRGIKPSNVILGDGRADSAHLVDFGLTGFLRIIAGLDEQSLFAAEHLSPEQSGLIDTAIDARSDLYSVGVLMYEALAGRPPFSGQTVGEVLRHHLTTRPPALATFAPDVPPALDRIIERLLSKDPRDRYQTAGGALADLEVVAAALAAGVPDPELIVGARDVRAALTEPAFIGRTEELATIDQVVARAAMGDGGLILVEGESGQGKTWLLAELSRRAMALGARVVHGRGVDAVAHRPYHVLDQMVRELVSMARIDPSWGRTIASQLGSSAAAACASLPALAALVPEQPHVSLGPEAHGEARSIAALAALIDATGAPGQPAVILLDDFQWADEATVRLFAQWQSRPEPKRRHVAVVLAFRSEDITGDHPLASIRPAHHLRLTSFATDEVHQQIASMAGQVPDRAIHAVERHAGGNPFLVSAMLHGMVEVGALHGNAAGWHLDPERLAEVQAADHAVHILTLRVAKLDDTSRHLLSVAALLGRTFDPVLAGALAGISPPEAIRIAEEHRGSLVWEKTSGTAFTFVHDRLRDTLLESLSVDCRRDLHRRAADHIQAADPQRVYELAYHFDAAREPARALPFAVAAAELARKRFALDVAERYYTIALRGATATDPRTQLSIHKGLGDVIALRNRYDEATEHYRRALDLAPSNLSRAEIEQRWSQLEMKRGDMSAACAHAEGALRLIGHPVPRHQALLAPWAMWEAAVQVLHTHFPRVFVRPRRTKRKEDLLAIDLYHGLNGPYFFSRGVMWAGWAHLRLINLAERYPGTHAMGRAYAAHAVSLNGFPRLFPRGLRISKAGADLCEELGDLWGQAQGLTFHAMMLYYAGRFSEAVEVGRKASRLFDRTGDQWEANSGLDFAVDALVRMGDLRGAVELAKEIWRRGVAIGDSHAMAWSLDAWSRATDGQVPSELIDIARARANDLQTALAVAQADGVRLIGAGRYGDAVEVLERARARNMKEAGYFYELNAPLLTYLTTALRKQAEEVSSWDPGRRQALLERAGTVSRQALSVARKFPLNLAHALREAAFVAAMNGDPEGARKHIDESIAVAAEHNERYEGAQSRLARSELGGVLGWADVRGDIDNARDQLEAMRATVRTPSAPPATGAPESEVTLSLVDRFATIIESGRAIATALSPEEIYAQIRRAALLLLRGERCVVLERSPGGDDPGPSADGFIPIHGDIGMVCSEDVIRDAFANDRTTVLSSPRDVTSLRSAVRSVLCIPIRVRGDAHACLYLTHGWVSGLFREGEKRIGDYLGSLAGAALENAEGFSQLKRFSRELEARVERRTRQLAEANRELNESLRQVHDTQEQLVQASKMAALGTLVAGLSHELNNPLSVVLGNVQLLLRNTPEDGSARRPLAAIERQALRCSRLVRALLNFSRARPSVRSRAQPEVLCGAVLDLVEGEARDKQVQVRHERGADPLPELMVFSQEIESALLNVLSNAIDASPAEGVVELKVRAATEDGVAGVAFAVSDRGNGIAKNVLPRIFDPFFTTKPSGRGTGLGLSIAHQAVTAHGGKIDADSTEGQGTTITIWLPAISD